jgi:quercetin dioxygenase-like cupin family protein
MFHPPRYSRSKNGVSDVDCFRSQLTALRGAAMQDALQLKAGLRLVASAAAIMLAVTVTVSAPKALAQASNGHTMFIANDIKWSAAPPSIPAGAQATVLYGNPGADGLFALRLKLPKGYALAPHTHPKPEIVTVISGTFRLGMGEAADRSKAQPLSAGSFFAMPPGMAHFAFADEETVIQLNSTGPWTLTYVNPSDDPRKETQ